MTKASRGGATLEGSKDDGLQVKVKAHTKEQGKGARLQMKPSLALYYDHIGFIHRMGTKHNIRLSISKHS